jgi:hypothetical protein
MESCGGEGSGSRVVVYKWKCWVVASSHCAEDLCTGGVLFFL